MDTKTFLQRLLPQRGLACLGVHRNGRFANLFFDSVDKMAYAAARFDRAGETVYHACAAYREKGSRKAANVEALKAFWLDIDCGDGKPYATQLEGVKGLGAFLRAVDLPAPTVVSSGGGLHVYWFLEEEVEPAAWRRIAEKLKVVSERAELQADPARTTDAASVLRPPGTTNRKRSPLPVRVLRDMPPVTVERFEAAIDAWLDANNIEVVVPEEFIAGTAPNGMTGPGFADLEYGHTKKTAHKVAERCAQLRFIRDVRGDCEEPLWYAGIGVLRHTIESPEIIHEWSNGYAGYSADETSAKIAHHESSGMGPTTCARFRQLNPKGCEGCTFAGQVKSPISLGRIDPDQECKPEDKVELTGLSLVDRRDAAPVNFVSGANGHQYTPADHRFAFTAGGGMQVRDVIGKNADGQDVFDWRQFSLTAVYPLCIVNGVDGKPEVTLRVHSPRLGWREIRAPQSALISGEKAMTTLTDLGINVSSQENAKLMTAYLRKEIDALLVNRDPAEEHDVMGWKDVPDGGSASFVWGTKKFAPGGKEIPVLLPTTRSARSTNTPLAFMRTAGDNGALRAAYALYDRPGLEAEQFVLLHQIAAPLTAWSGQDAVLSLTGGSGRGKSTVGYVALAAYGHPERMKRTARDTERSLYATAGMYQSLPLMIDEITTMEAKEAGDFLYAASEGQERNRLNAEAKLVTGYHWKTSFLLTTNSSMASKVAAFRYDSAPSQYRLVEIDYDGLKRPLTKAEADNFLMPVARGEHFGWFAEPLLRYIVDHQVTLRGQMKPLIDAVGTQIGAQSNERFWVASIAKALMMNEIGNQLGLWTYKAKTLKNYIFGELVPQLRHSVNEAAHDPVSVLTTFLNDSFGSCLVGNHALMRGSVQASDIQSITLPRTGRVVMRLCPDVKRLFISRDFLRAAGENKHFDMAACLRRLHGTYKALVDVDGRQVLGTTQVNLGKGTQVSTGTIPVVGIDLTKLPGFEAPVLAGGA